MKVSIASFLLFFVAALFCCANGFAAPELTLRGKVLDSVGKGVEGAEVFVYDSTNTRRPADFISGKTDSDGRYTIQLPVGKYWAVARVRQGEKYGPLAAGAKHSGEPLTVEDAADGVAEQDFVVADIRDVAKGQRKTNDDYVKVSGRVLDRDGNPVGSAYVVAHTSKHIDSLPAYLSAWTDESGAYSLYLPVGSYYVGAATTFPPDVKSSLQSSLAVEASKIDIAIDITITLK